MGCTTNGFVLTNKKNVFNVWRVVKSALIATMQDESGLSGHELWHKSDGQYSYPTCDLYDVGMITVSFTFKGEQRDLHIHFECDSDYSYYKKGKKIITSLGAWGSSVFLTEKVLYALSELGSIHIVDNDCSDEWRELK